MHGAPYTNLALEECDLLIAVGARLTTAPPARWRRSARTRRLFTSTSTRPSWTKIKTAHVGIAGDVGAVLAQLLPQVQASCAKTGTSAWPSSGRAAAAIARPGRPTQPLRPGAGRGRRAGRQRLCRHRRRPASDVGGASLTAAPPAPMADLWRPGHHGLWLPTAIGAALANPERTVVCFSGDGSILMNIQEFATWPKPG